MDFVKKSRGFVGNQAEGKPIHSPKQPLLIDAQAPSQIFDFLGGNTTLVHSQQLLIAKLSGDVRYADRFVLARLLKKLA